MVSKDNELERIDLYKVILMVIIVFYHCACMWSKGWAPVEMIGSDGFTFVINYITSWLNTFHIYGFVFASGYLFYYLRYELGKYRNRKSDIKNRAKRLLVPYVAVSIIWVIPFNLLNFDYSMGDIAKKFLLTVSPSQLWFLIMLFDVYLIFYLLSDKLFRKNTVLGLVVLYVINIIGALLLALSGIFNIFQIGVALKYLIFFYIGGLYRRKKYINNSVLITIMMMLVSLCGSYLSYNSMVNTIVIKLFMPIISICGVLGTFNIISCLNQYIKKDNKLYKLLRKYSMAVYLIHQQIIQLFARILQNVNLPEICILLMVFVLVLGICLIISMIVSKFRIGRLVLGIK